MNRATMALSKGTGGLNLLGVKKQYYALSGKFMLWLMSHEPHPLGLILQAHIFEVSHGRWGSRDLSWIFSKCGALQLTGSAPWLNICKLRLGYAEEICQVGGLVPSGSPI